MTTNRTILLAFIMLIANLGFAQVSKIKLNMHDSNFQPRLMLEESILYITSPTGVYILDLNNMDNSTYKMHELYAFGGTAVCDFVSKGDSILAVTDNCYPAGHIFAVKASEDYNDMTLYTPNEFKAYSTGEFAYYDYTVDALVQHPNDDNTLLATCLTSLFRSEDFGATWTKIGDYSESTGRRGLAYNPNNPDIIIYSSRSFTEAIGSDYFQYSIDGGKNWKEQTGFIMPEGIAFHPTDPNTVVIAGVAVAVSKDGCKTWDYTKRCFDFIGPIQISFDSRNPDRLYGRVMQEEGYTFEYSDDMGASWNVLCDLPFSGEFVDFVQYGSKIYCLSSNNELCEVDLDKIDLSVTEIISNDAIRLSQSEGEIGWQSEKMLSRVEVVSTEGIILAQQEVAGTKGEIMINEDLTGVAIVAFYTADGQCITRKIKL